MEPEKIKELWDILHSRSTTLKEYKDALVLAGLPKNKVEWILKIMNKDKIREDENVDPDKAFEMLGALHDAPRKILGKRILRKGRLKKELEKWHRISQSFIQKQG